MKNFDHKKIQKRFQKQDKFYGTTTMGARGQVVIPAQARKVLGLKPGDQLAVIGKFNKVLGLVKTEALASLVDAIMKNLEGTGMEGQVKKHFDNFLINHK